LRVAFVGEVDHGKSSLIGRLATAKDVRSPLRLAAARTTDPAHIVDQLEEERSDAMTIDTTEALLAWRGARLTLIDAPGHLELLKNMVTGVSRADAAVLVIDAAQGIQPQTLRHLAIAELLGCRRLLVAVNKMDLTDAPEATLAAVAAALKPQLAVHGFADATFVPVSAASGDGIESFSARLSWCHERPLLKALFTLTVDEPTGSEALRVPLQDIYTKAGDLWLVGRIAQGTLARGATVRCAASDSLHAVEQIVAFPHQLPLAQTGDCVALRLSPAPQAARRGDVLIAATDTNATSSRIDARIVWLAASPLAVGDVATVRCATQTTTARVAALTIVGTRQGCTSLALGELATATLALATPLVIGGGAASPLGRIALAQSGVLVAGGCVQ